MPRFEAGTKVQAFGKSKHAGQTGIVVADYINMILVKALNPKYELAHNNSIGEGKYFQVDSRYCKETK